MSRYLLLISNQGNTFYKECITYSDSSFLVDYKDARELGRLGAWRLTESKRSKPDICEIRTLTRKACTRTANRRLIRERLARMGATSVSQLKENQLQTYYNFIRQLVK